MDKDLDRYYDIGYLRTLSICELKFLSIFMTDDKLIKKELKEKVSKSMKVLCEKRFKGNVIIDWYIEHACYKT